jgi:hypothetical protein
MQVVVRLGVLHLGEKEGVRDAKGEGFFHNTIIRRFRPEAKGANRHEGDGLPSRFFTSRWILVIAFFRLRSRSF